MKNNDPIFWPSTQESHSLKMQIDKNYSDCINILQTIWYQCDIDQRFALGDQDIWGLIFPGVATYRRKMFNFNIINAIIQAISGHQRTTRKTTIAIPVLSPMQKTADQLTKCLYYIQNNFGTYQIFSDGFEQGALTQGLGFYSMFLDYASDPISPDIRMRYIDPKACLFDPYFRRHDMSDCRFFWTRQFFDREEAAILFPSMRNKILELPRGGFKDDKFYYMPEVYQIQTSNLIAFDEYWYLSSRQATYLIDLMTEEAQEFQGDEEDLRVVKSQMGDRIKIVRRPKQTVRRSIILNDRVVVDEANPYGLDRYPIVPALAYFTPDTPYYAYKFRGVTRDMRDAQYLFNRRKVADLDILDSQQQGVIIEQGSLVTPDDSLNSGHGRVLVRKKGTTPDAIQPMQIIPPSPVMLQMEEMLMNIAYRISGVDPASMGIEVDDKAGIISMMRQVATARNLQKFFDQVDEAQRLCGDITVEMIQKNWSYGKIRNIIGEEPTAEFDNKLFFKYGCKVIQGNLTETQQQLELAQLLHFREIFGEIMPIEPIIKAATIQNKDELIQTIMQNQQAAQEQQQQMAELQMQQLQVDNETKLAYARSQDGLAQERVAKIRTDVAIAEDKLKRAEREDTASLLNLVKVLEELKGMNTQDISAKIDIIRQINEIEYGENNRELANQPLQK